MIDGWIDSERLVIDIAYQFYFFFNFIFKYLQQIIVNFNFK